MSLALIFGALLLMQQTTAIEQVGALPESREVATLEQLADSVEADVTEPIGQPTADDGSDVEQLTEGDSSVELARVEGLDRCSAELLSPEDAAFCARRIETRSAEFTNRSAPILSAEEVLVGERYAAAAGIRVAEASRGPQVRDASPEDRELQALASITLAPAAPTSPPAEEEEALPDATQALIEAIVNQLSQPGGN